MTLLYQAIDGGYGNIAWMRDDPDLRSLHKYQPFAELLRKHRMDWGYSAIWHDSATQESAESHDLDPAAHLSRCQQLIRAGYRPATIAVVEMSRGEPLVTASVWHRPVVATKDRVELARRRANAAIGLMRLGKTEQVWELLRQQTEPDVRTYLIDRLGPLGADPRSLISRLETESDVWVRRALLLSLGEFRADQLRSVPADQRNRLASLMQRWYRDDPDPGIHAVLAWLSRPGETGRIHPKLDWGLRAALEATDRELTSKPLASQRNRLASLMQRWYRDDPDPGIHAALAWLSRPGETGRICPKLDWGLRAALEAADRELTSKALACWFGAASRHVGLLALLSGLGRLSEPGLTSLSPSGPEGERRWYVNGQGQTLALFRDPVPFTMGSLGFEPGRFGGEKAHRRRIRRNFALGTEPVTIEQFQRFLKDHPEVRHSIDRRSSPDLTGPIVGVSWYEAAQYCRWLSEQEGVPENQMCYPSIKVIEKCKAGEVLSLRRKAISHERGIACRRRPSGSMRAGPGRPRAGPSGGPMRCSIATPGIRPTPREWARPVGRKKPNDFGLFDMHGNVMQWCHDRDAPYPVMKPESPADDKEDLADITRDGLRVQRGGSYASPERSVRSARRWKMLPDGWNPMIGFRVARTFP